MSLKKNINRKSGIFLSDIVYFILIIAVISLPKSLDGREYEVQFFSVNNIENLDFNLLKNYGIDKIIIRSFQNKEEPMGLLFGNTSFIVQERLLEKIALKNKIAKRIDESVSLSAWMITRNFNWIKEKRLFDSKYYDDKLEKVKKLDLFNERAVNKIISVYRELARNTIDGILIQDDLILKYNEGMSEDALGYFEKKTGMTANMQKMIKKGTIYNSKWLNIKKNKILEVLEKIIDVAKKVNPNIKIGMNIYYETPIYIDRAEQWYAHNLNELVKTKLDYIYLMSYQRQIKNELKFTEKENKKFFKKIVEKAYEIAGDKLIVKIQVYDWKTRKRVPKREIIRYLRLIPRSVKRVCFTPVKTKDMVFIKRIIRKNR